MKKQTNKQTNKKNKLPIKKEQTNNHKKERHDSVLRYRCQLKSLTTNVLYENMKPEKKIIRWFHNCLVWQSV